MRTLVKSFARGAPVFKEADLARQAGRQLRSALANGRAGKKTLQVQIKAKSSAAITIPISAARVLADVLEQMARGNAATAMPLHRELTTQAAADLLQVSRPFLVSQLERGLIPFRMVGSHRRVRLEDVLAFKKQLDTRRLKTLSKLSALDQNLGFI